MTRLEDYYRERVGQEAFDFFAVFARFEYALKFGGFCRANQAEASWHNFAEALPPDFFDRMRAAQEARIYFEHPPQTLKKDGDVLQWCDETLPASALDLFMALKRARNNLFHGDKRHDNRRDRDLMVAGLFILNQAYDAADTHPPCAGFVGAMEYGL